MKNILFITNGHGEDMVPGELAMRYVLGIDRVNSVMI